MTSPFSQGSRALCVGALFALAPAPPFAHAHLVRAQPASGATVKTSPQAVTITFSEGVVPRLSGIAISDAGGKPVAAGPPASAGGAASLSVAIGKPLAPGTYHVTWRAVSVDSHRTQGHFSFTVAP